MLLVVLRRGGFVDLAQLQRHDLEVPALEPADDLTDEATAAKHYAEHEGKGFYGELIEFITRSPAVVMVVEGPEDTWQVARTMIGATNPRDAAPGTIRGDLGILFTENLIHGSDSAESAEREIGIWFPGLA